MKFERLGILNVQSAGNPSLWKLIGFENHPHARSAHPTPDHFFPLLYVIGAAEGEDPTFFCEEIFAASLSMRSVAYGLDTRKTK